MSALLPLVVPSVVPVTELYCDVLQGEGPSVGKFCSFIRFTGCHRECNWCDSSHTWKKGQIVTKKMNLVEIREFLEKGKARLLVLTGGEPLLHQDKAYFMDILDWYTRGWEFEIETEGTFLPSDKIKEMVDAGLVRINCSPKLSHAGMGNLSSEYMKSLPEIVKLPGSILKFVVRNGDDVEEALKLCEQVKAENEQIYLMPEGVTTEEQLKKLPLVYDLAIEYGVNFTPRLHVLRWDSKKGV